MKMNARWPRAWIAIEGEVARFFAEIREAGDTRGSDAKVSEAAPLAVAVSGGADSVFLLHTLARLREEATKALVGGALAGQRLLALHVNHGVRGAAADADADFVRGLAASLGADFAQRRLGGRPGAKASEAVLRDERFAALRAMMEEAGAISLCLAHQRDDRAETLLHRLLRGAGPEGLAGMRGMTPWEGLRLLRPLLHVGREEIRRCLVARGIAWREDASNTDTDFTRNRLRHETLPELERAYHPQLRERLAALAEQFDEDRDYWEATVAAWFADEPEYPRAVNRERFQAAPRALRRRLLGVWLAHAARGDKQVERKHIDAAEEFVLRAAGKGALDTVAGAQLLLEAGRIALRRVSPRR